MFIQRGPLELYLQGTTLPGQPNVFGWVERVDPETLEPHASTGELPTGGHEWCGAVIAHANGDLYAVNGRYLHRIDPNCDVVIERVLPTDWSHNGLLVLADGTLVTKDLRLEEPTTLLLLEPERLEIIARATVPEPSMGRLAVDETDDGTFIYVVGRERIFRYRWFDRLELDRDWQPQYRSDSNGVQGLAWDVTLVDGHVWLHDNGDVFGVRALFSAYPNRLPFAIDERAAPDLPVPWTGAQRVVRVSAVNPSDVAAFEPFGDPGGWIIAPPLVHDGVVVTWDSGNRRLSAFRSDSDGTFERLWEKPFRQTIQPMVYAETRELIVNDAQTRADSLEDDVVVLDLDSGHEKGRVRAGARGNGMFFCPGWQRDLYYCTWFKVARVRVSD